MVQQEHLVGQWAPANDEALRKQFIRFYLSPRLCPSTAGCSPASMPSIVLCLLPSSFTFHLGFVHPLQDVTLHQCLPLSSVAFLFHLSPRLCPSTAGCSPPSVPSIVLCLLLSCFTFHLGFVHPLQDVALHQCLPLSSVACLFQAVPSFLAVSSCHLLLGCPLDLFPLLGCFPMQCLVHLLSFIFARCPAHVHFHFRFSV